jgi:hypothetical protein
LPPDLTGPEATFSLVCKPIVMYRLPPVVETGGLI